MPYNLLLLPVIVGYFILNHSYFFKYNTQRFSPSRIIYESISIALFLIVFGFILRTFFQWCFPSFLQEMIILLNKIPIQKVDYFWTVVFSCVLALLFVFGSNFYLKKNYQESQFIAWAVEKNGDEIEKLFKKSVEEGCLLQITLKNDKVYIGYSEIIPIPQKTNYLILTPVLSGYRDEKKQLHITTDYYKAIDDFLKGLDTNNKSNQLNTEIIIKQDEILTAGMYEQQIFEKFNQISKA